MSDRKRKACLGCLGLLGLIVILPTLGYYLTQSGYCRGWWGKQNLVFRSLWLCSCPPELEQSLYPEHVEVMFSACQEVTFMPTWDGYFFISGDKNYEGGQSYLLSGYTEEKVAYTPPTKDRVSMHFYTHELLYATFRPLRTRSPEIHHVDGWYVALEHLSDPLPPPFLNRGRVNPEMMALFEDSTRIFLHRSPPNSFIVALSIDANGVGQSGFILSSRRFPELEPEWSAQFLEASGLAYISIPPPDRALSPDGRFRARADGIYDLVSGELVVANPLPSPSVYSRSCCWWPDGSAALYLPGPHHPPGHLVPWKLEYTEVGAPFQLDRVSLPILKLRLPEEYRHSEPP